MLNLDGDSSFPHWEIHHKSGIYIDYTDIDIFDVTVNP